jgi:hypothetical protein
MSRPDNSNAHPAQDKTTVAELKRRPRDVVNLNRPMRMPPGGKQQHKPPKDRPEEGDAA